MMNKGGKEGRSHQGNKRGRERVRKRENFRQTKRRDTADTEDAFG